MSSNPFFRINQDATTPAIDAALLDEAGQPVDLAGATVAFALYELGGDEVFERGATIVAPLSGHVRYTWQAGDTATAGRYLARFIAVYPSFDVQLFPDEPRYIRVTVV